MVSLRMGRRQRWLQSGSIRRYSRINRDFGELDLEVEHLFCELLGINRRLLASGVNAFETGANDLLVDLERLLVVVIILRGETESALSEPCDEVVRVALDVAVDKDVEEGGNGCSIRILAFAEIARAEASTHLASEGTSEHS